jgi:thioredoxin-like negative regulator of GroEL
MRLNATQLEFLTRLGKSPEGQQLQALIKAEIDETNVQLRSLTGEHLYREQGKATYLDALAGHLTGRMPKRDAPRAPFQRPPGDFA